MSEPIQKPDGTEGSQPQWPGEKCRQAGRYDKTTRKSGEGEIVEETIIPIVDSVPGKQV